MGYSLGDRLPPTLADPATGNAVNLETFSCDGLAIGPLKLPTPDGVCSMDLERFRRVSGEDIYGILGFSFFSHHIVQIDFDQGTIRVFSSATPISDEWGRPFSLATVGRDLVGVFAQPGDGLPYVFLIDTGSNTTGSLNCETYDRLIADGQLSNVRTGVHATLAGTFATNKGRLETLELGRHTHDGLVFGRAKRNKLGLKFWSRYCVTFDVPRKTLYLRPGKHHQVPDRLDASGLHLLLIHGEPVVQIVDEGSPGWRAGMKSGDVLVNIDGTRAIDLKLFQIRQLLLEDGLPRVKIVYRRDEREHETVVELQPTEEALPR